MVDLSTIKPSERQLEIINPETKAPIGLRIGILSIEDDRLKSVKRQILNARLDNEKRNKTFKAEDLEVNHRELMFTATTGWEWYNPTGSQGDSGYDSEEMASFEGEQPEYNKRNFNRVFNVAWIADQINEAVNDTDDFFTKSKSN